MNRTSAIAAASLLAVATLAGCGSDETEGKTPDGLASALTRASAPQHASPDRYFDAAMNTCKADDATFSRMAQTFARPDNAEGAKTMQAAIDYLCPSRSTDFRVSVDTARAVNGSIR